MIAVRKTTRILPAMTRFVFFIFAVPASHLLGCQRPTSEHSHHATAITDSSCNPRCTAILPATPAQTNDAALLRTLHHRKTYLTTAIRCRSDRFPVSGLRPPVFCGLPTAACGLPIHRQSSISKKPGA